MSVARRLIVGASIAAISFSACKDDIPPAPSGIAIDPREGPNNRPTHVMLSGDFISVRVGVNFDDPSSSTIDKRMSADLRSGSATFGLSSIQIVGPGQVGAQVPGVGMPIGDYDLIVTDVAGQSTMLGGAFHIRQGTCDDLTPPNRTSNSCMAGCDSAMGCGCFGKQPAVCKTLCGDGKVVLPEVCDDGNTVDGDGCSHDCRTIEDGWSCTQSSPAAASVCAPICGDGLIVGAERAPGGCDDHNTNDGDGCSHDCMIEPGWTCDGSPSVCQKCGDGRVEGREQCDDGNIKSGDGCNPSCAVEPGWTCTKMTGATSVCTLACNSITTCGNGIIETGEACDDGNTNSGDGCNACCQIEPGFACLRQPSACVPISDSVFVSANNQCPGTGTRDNPYCNIQLGVDDTRIYVVVEPGQYHESVEINGTTRVLIGGNPGGQTGSSPVAQSLDIHGGAKVHVLGVDIRQGNGVTVSDPGTSANLLDCRIGPSSNAGVSAAPGTVLTLDRDYITQNTKGGLVLGGLEYHVTNSIIVQNGTAGSVTFGVAIVLSSTVSTFVNNTVADNLGPDVAQNLSCFTSSTSIVNTIVWSTQGTSNVIGPLCVPRYCDLPQQVHIGGNISADPMFVAGYHIGQMSPCIDHGDPTGTVTTGGPAPVDDFSGDSRPRRNGVDIGADEVP
jgi:cysteine-rich repeat protein